MKNQYYEDGLSLIAQAEEKGSGAALFIRALENWIHDIQADYKIKNPNPINDCQFTYSKGGKYYKVIRNYNGQKSVHSFVDGNGYIWKPAGWKAPAKNFARGNIFTTPPITNHL